MRALMSCLLAAVLASAATASGTLDIYFIDVEGGQATLIVAPSGESMLVDAGWPGFDGRDADRILAAARQAGVKKIDYMLVTHYHTDHVGGVPQLAERIAIENFVDHGPNTETQRERSVKLAGAYYKARDRGRHLVVKPGDTVPLAGAEVRVVAARGEVLGQALPGAGRKNPLCEGVARKPADTGENGKSVGFLLTYGKFRFIDLGDLTWNYELDLACPVNKIGEVDVYLTTHHGLPSSGPAAIVHALRPRVGIMNNGAKKGGAPEASKVVRTSPGLEGFWQLHHKVGVDDDGNVAEKYIANVAEDGKGHALRLSARSNGAFTLTNLRNGYTETYQAD